MSSGDKYIVWPDGVRACLRGSKPINVLSYQVCCAGGGCIMCGSAPALLINEDPFCNKCQHDYGMLWRMYYRGGLDVAIETMKKIYKQKQLATKEARKFKNGKIINKRS